MAKVGAHSQAFLTFLINMCYCRSLGYPTLNLICSLVIIYLFKHLPWFLLVLNFTSQYPLALPLILSLLPHLLRLRMNYNSGLQVINSITSSIRYLMSSNKLLLRLLYDITI